MELFRRENQIFRRVLRVADVDWCKFMSGRSKGSSAIFKTVVDIVKNHSPSVFQLCPYEGVYKVFVSFEYRSILIFPVGSYQFVLKVKTIEEVILTAAVYFEINL